MTSQAPTKYYEEIGSKALSVLIPKKDTIELIPTKHYTANAEVEKAHKRPSQCSFQVAFLVDASGSMSNSDVESACGRISRIDAVFDAIGCFAQALQGLDGVTCSIAIFNESHHFAMRSQPVGIHFSEELRKVRQAVRPKGGGIYMDALRAFSELASPSGVTVGVLLSDGVPSESMRDFDCAGTPNVDRVLGYMRALRGQLGQKCILHTVGFGKFDATCLRALACDGGGTFHSNNDLQSSALRNTFRRLFGVVSTLRATVMEFGEGALEPLPPREMEPTEAWEQASPEELERASRQLKAWIMMPPKQKGSTDAELVPVEPPTSACVHIKPFAEGGLRYAFHFFLLDRDKKRGLHLVVKEGKFAAVSSSPLSNARSFLKNHDKAKEIAAAFRQACSTSGAGAIAAKFVPAFVIKTADPTSCHDVHYSTAERFIQGEFVKMNGNDGYVNGSIEAVHAQAAGAFSHFSFDHSGGALMCVDVQGSGLEWTDPQLHSVDRSFGPADLGKEGMRLFFSTHVCSSFCAKLKLRTVDPESLELGVQLDDPCSSSASSSSSSDTNDQGEDSCSDEQGVDSDSDDQKALAAIDDLFDEMEASCKTCPAGHALSQFKTPTGEGDWCCSMCHGPVAEGSSMWGCRPCDYDLCTRCWPQAMLVAPKQPKLQQQASASHQLLAPSRTNPAAPLAPLAPPMPKQPWKPSPAHPLRKRKAPEGELAKSKDASAPKPEKVTGSAAKVPKLEKALGVAGYIGRLIAYLQGRGRVKIGFLGSVVPRSEFPGAPKLTAALRSRPDKFDLDPGTQTVAIKR